MSSVGRLVPTSAHSGTFPRAFSYPTLPNLVDVGRITRARDGGLWYVQRAPYLVEKYSVDGTLLLQIERRNSFLPGADRSVRVAVSGSRVTFSSRPRPRAVIAKELRDGSLAVQIAVPDGTVITDLYSFVNGRSTATPQLRFSWVGTTPILSEQIGEDLFVVQVGGRDSPYGVAAVRMHPAPR